VSDADLERFLLEEAGRGGNIILQHPVGKGKLFLGGSGASAPRFVHAERIARVVNTASGLEAVNPAWARQVATLISEVDIFCHPLTRTGGITSKAVGVGRPINTENLESREIRSGILFSAPNQSSNGPNWLGERIDRIHR
jgi:hypothetical protein